MHEVSKNKSTGYSIPTKVLKVIAKEICVLLKDCKNKSFSNDQFPGEPKMADLTSIF